MRTSGLLFIVTFKLALIWRLGTVPLREPRLAPLGLAAVMVGIVAAGIAGVEPGMRTATPESRL